MKSPERAHFNSADTIISLLTSEKEYESKQKELESVANPVLQKVYASAGGAGGAMLDGMPGDMPGAGTGADSRSSGAEQGPKIEEVDEVVTSDSMWKKCMSLDMPRLA
ncbi:uncharacterized protein PITG_11248 [Phytophthora infestans T30-4]|uniref:Uncharacterized protein n=1 Tax=Phytophthora infestans (strain T30-4) TaxID=403677 RepID=D0NGJ6_PHYIT|nr:uncharacterized protein PITG_11248 [Phytophthora infestans T30-4]EEY57397.1 hypothetical protein PITG_11248 [Phytophthora infestans T30-4]|eukprot:XP_002902007.1 hypothetical protein PITG_11248 [Phytophthora infestans T30-4]